MKYWVLDKIFNHPSKPRQMEYLVVDQSFIIIDTSEKVQRFSEHPDRVKPGKDIRDSFPELIGFEDTLIAILQGQQESLELKGIAILDSSQPCYVDIYVIGDQNNNKYTNLLVLFEDVTEKMVLEQDLAQTIRETTLQSIALNADKNYLVEIIASIPDALIVTTYLGKIKIVNRSTLELFGYSEAELIGKPISTLVVDEKVLDLAGKQTDLYGDKCLKNIKLICQTKTKQNICVTFSRSVIQMKFEDYQDFVYLGKVSYPRECNN